MSESETDETTDSAGGSAAEFSLDTSVAVVNVQDVEPYENNPVDHPDKQIDALKESIQKFGFKSPIVLTPDNEIVAGHARVQAVTELKGNIGDKIAEHAENGNDQLARNLTLINNGQIHAIISDDLTEQELDEFRIADNKVFEHSTWDTDSLRFELRELESAIGFEDEEVDSLLNVSSGEIDYDPGEVEEEKKKLERHYQDLAEEKQKRKGAIPCPHCDSVMYLDKGELSRALRSAQKDQQEEDAGGTSFDVS